MQATPTDSLVSTLSAYMRPGYAGAANMNMPFHCPFHGDGNEASPSLYVYIGPSTHSRTTGSSFCHACDRGWSLVSLLRELNVPRRLVDSIVEAEVGDRRSRRPVLDRGILTTPVLPETFVEIFKYKPLILADKFNDETLKTFEIGYDPPRLRTMFPLRSFDGRLAGYSGRNSDLRTEPNRYKIYREEFAEWFPGYSLDKSKILWGAHLLYDHSVNSGKPPQTVVVCEGFKATMWVWQCGFKRVVALIGTHMSAAQLLLLERITNNVVVFLDNDRAGRGATEKLLMNRRNSLEMKIARYNTEAAVSPDDLSPDRVADAITNPISHLEWRMTWLSQQRKAGKIS